MGPALPELPLHRAPESRHEPPRYPKSDVRPHAAFFNRLLESILRKVRNRNPGAPTINPSKRAIALNKTLAPAQDIPAAARDALAQCAGRYDAEQIALATVRLLHWLKQDPAAAFAYLKGPNGTEYGEMRDYAVSLYLAEMESSELMRLFETPEGLEWKAHLLPGLVSRLAQAKDVEHLRKLATQLDGSNQKLLYSTLAKSWPSTDARGLLELARQLNAPELVRDFTQRMPINEALAWVEQEMANHPNAPFTNALANNPTLALHFLRASQLPAEERISGIMRFNNGMSREEATQWVAALSVLKSPTGDDTQSMRQRFRTGDLTASELWEMTSRQQPEFAAAHPVELRLELFRQLARMDADKALTLWNDDPSEERTRAILDVLKSNGGYTLQQQIIEGSLDPRQAFALLNAIPNVDTEEATHQRLQLWESLSQINYRTHGDAYVAWVESLPAGRDRDLAVTALANELKDNDPMKASQLSQQAVHPSDR